MSRFVNEINDSPLAAERAEKDILGNKIDTTYAKLSDIPEDKIFMAQYNVSTYSEISTAITEGKNVLLVMGDTGPVLNFSRKGQNSLLFSGIYNQNDLDVELRSVEYFIATVDSENTWEVSCRPFFILDDKSIEVLNGEAIRVHQQSTTVRATDGQSSTEWFKIATATPEALPVLSNSDILLEVIFEYNWVKYGTSNSGTDTEVLKMAIETYTQGNGEIYGDRYNVEGKLIYDNVPIVDQVVLIGNRNNASDTNFNLELWGHVTRSDYVYGIEQLVAKGIINEKYRFNSVYYTNQGYEREPFTFTGYTNFVSGYSGTVRSTINAVKNTDSQYQQKLTAGSNISIDSSTNTISAQVPPDFSSVIPSDASSSNKLVSTNTLDARLADFGGFKEVQGTGADLHPNVPSGEEDSKLIYLVRDNSATGDDKYKEWIWDSGDPEANPPVSAQWKLIGDTTMHLEGYVQKVQIDGTEIPATSGTVNIPLAVADDYGTSGTDGALSKEDKEKIDSYKYMYLSGGTSGEKIYANSPDLNLDVGFLTLGNTGFGQVPGFVAVGRAGQDECFFGNQGSDPAFGVYDNQSQQFAVKELLTEDSYIISNLQNGKADKVYDATSGNLAALDEDGNLMDSGIDPSQLNGNLKQGLQGLQGTQIPANSDMNTYTTPGNYYIASAADMVTISHTPYTHMGLSNTSKTGQSQVTVYNMNGTSSGRVMQVMYTIYSTNPENDNAFGFWFRMSSGGSSQTWGTWKRLGEQDNRFWCGYKNSANYLLITVKQIPGGTAGDSILISFTGNQYGVMLKLCFGIASEGGFNNTTPTLHVIEANNLLGAAYNPLYTSGGGVAKYYYDSTNKLYYFLLKTTATNRMMCTIESVNPGNYSFSTPSEAPSWLSSASNIATGHALPHIADSRVGNAIGSSTQPVYVNANGSIEPCSVSDSHYYGGSAQMSATCAYNYVKAGVTLTVNVATMLNEKTYYAHVVRPDGSSTATITVKFTSSSSFNVYGNSTTITGTTTYTASRGPNPVIFMKNGSNLYILGY
jgi:hypothetical protein